jgi:cytochrome c2
MRMRDLYLGTLVVALLWPCSGFAGDAAEKGKQVYEREKCAMCHSIAGKGNKRNPLDGMGGRLGRDEIRKWIVSPQEMKPGVKKKAFDKLADEDLEALVDYIESLKE